MKNKIAKNEKEGFRIQEKFEDHPHASIQWKGTNVCMDIRCKCGYQSHLDADFAYSVKCPKCLTVYMCNGHIELIELIEEPEHTITPELNYEDT